MPEFIVGYSCMLCHIKLIKSRYIHLESRLHQKNLEAYEKEHKIISELNNIYAEKDR